MVIARDIFFYAILTQIMDTEEMPNKATFNLGLYYLLTQNRFSEKEIQYLFENYNL